MINERLMQIILSPVVSEKSQAMAEAGNFYAFRVRMDASKPEIRDAVEQLFEVSVEKVRTVRIKGKNKRFGQRLGRRQDVKKAYVRLKPGQSIDLGTGG